MTILNSLSSVTAKPGVGFVANGAVGFQGKLHHAMEKNADGLGYLKKNTAALDALHAQIVKNKHLIHQGGWSEHKAKMVLDKITHEVHLKGEHLSASQHEALKKLTHHLTKVDHTKRMVGMGQLAHHQGISSISAQQHVGSVHQIGDQTHVTSGEEPHASGGIASSIKRQHDLPTNLPTHSTPKPLSIKLSV